MGDNSPAVGGAPAKVLAALPRQAGHNAREFVADVVKHVYCDGRSVALTYNDDDPKEVQWMVSHCWDEALDVFLRDVLTLTIDSEPAVFICFLALYQGTHEEVNLQVTQGSTDASEGCFGRVLSTVERNGGPMLVVSNEAVCDTGGLYSRLWCVWEVYCAMREDVPLVMHPRTSTEEHLFGGRGSHAFEPQNARCGAPGSSRTADEIGIRRAIDGGASCCRTLPFCGSARTDWAQIKSTITYAMSGHFGLAAPGVLNFWNCGLGDSGVLLLLEAMKESPRECHRLYLAENAIGDHGAEALAVALHSNSTLSNLNLGNNHISDDGAKALAVALDTNTTLTDLILGQNRISDDGAKALAVALDTNTTLTRLSLSQNRISDDGAKAS